MSQIASLSSNTETSVCSRSEWVERTLLYGSTTDVETCGEGQTVNPSLDFFPQSTESRSSRREPRPEPVPPPTALKTRKPWRPVQLSASFLMRSRQRSTISFPTAQCENTNAIRILLLKCESEEPKQNLKGAKQYTGIMSTRKVVSCVFLATDELLWVEELAVCSSPHLINDRGLKI